MTESLARGILLELLESLPYLDQFEIRHSGWEAGDIAEALIVILRPSDEVLEPLIRQLADLPRTPRP